MDERTRPQGSSVHDGSQGARTGMEERPRGPHNIESRAAEFDASIRAADDEAAAAAERSRLHGVSVPLLESGAAVRGMIQALFHTEATDPAHLRPVADAFRRHCAAKEATIGRTLESRSSAAPEVRRDREEGTHLLALLDGAVASPGTAGISTLTVRGVLADIDQYLAHEQRDLVPLIERELPVSQSEHLAAAFHA